MGFPGGDGTAGQDQVHGPRLADQAGQPHGAQVNQRHAETAAEDAEHSAFGGDPQVGPQGQLQAPGDGVALHGGDHRLVQPHPGRTHGTKLAVLAHGVGAALAGSTL